MISTNTTPPLFALLGSIWARRQIQFALHSGNALRIIGPVIFASGWQELRDLAARFPGSPAIVDPFFGGGCDPFRGKRDYANADWSSVPLICYAQLDAHQEDQLDQTAIPFAVRLRPDEDRLFSSIDSAILKSIDAQRPRRLLERIQRTAHKETQALFACALEIATEPCSVAGLAARSGLTVRTLQRRCNALGIPSPKQLLSLARVFTVERLSEWSRQQSGGVALALGFSDRSNYRRLVRRVLGAAPSPVRQRGGVKYIEGVIISQLANSGGVAEVESLAWPKGLAGLGEAAAVLLQG